MERPLKRCWSISVVLVVNLPGLLTFGVQLSPAIAEIRAHLLQAEQKEAVCGGHSSRGSKPRVVRIEVGHRPDLGLFVGAEGRLKFLVEVVSKRALGPGDVDTLLVLPA